MKTWKSFVIVGALAVLVVTAVAVKQARIARNPDPVVSAGSVAAEGSALVALPRLVDLGADKCIPCKMMAPILEELKTGYAGKMNVEFIDVWKHPDEAGPYGVRVIPTQVFFDASGTELFRHEGFMSKEDILARCADLGMLPSASADGGE